MLETFFQTWPEVGIAFSGGVDSAYLLYEAVRLAKHVKAYYVKSCFQPEFELEDACRLAEELGAEMEILTVDVLSVPEVRKNPENRCYFCKRKIFETIFRKAKEDGFSVLLDGTNASDDAGDRPGMKALKELSVLSPLRDCNLTKAEIRKRSKDAGLFTWNKPAYACLATRIPAGEELTEEKLQATEGAESFLFSLGFSDFRVRSSNGHARIQIPEDQTGLLLRERKKILSELGKNFKSVSMDLMTR